MSGLLHWVWDIIFCLSQTAMFWRISMRHEQNTDVSFWMQRGCEFALWPWYFLKISEWKMENFAEWRKKQNGVGIPFMFLGHVPRSHTRPGLHSMLQEFIAVAFPVWIWKKGSCWVFTGEYFECDRGWWRMFYELPLVHLVCTPCSVLVGWYISNFTSLGCFCFCFFGQQRCYQAANENWPHDNVADLRMRLIWTKCIGRKRGCEHHRSWKPGSEVGILKV